MMMIYIYPVNDCHARVSVKQDMVNMPHVIGTSEFSFGREVGK